MHTARSSSRFWTTVPWMIFLGMVPITAQSVQARDAAANHYASPPVRPRAVKPNPATILAPKARGPMVTVPEGEPLPSAPPAKRKPIRDGVTQVLESGAEVAPPGLISNPIVNHSGITSNSNPPDTVGDVGLRHFVQMVNATQYQVFNKSGVSVFGPATFGNLWPVGDVCNSNAGDPIVVYDHLAARWLLSQFANPSHMCIAISQTPDPAAGSWFLYTFNVGTFPDYPKFGVWPDGYYMTSYEGSNLGVFVFDRANMLLGNAASFLKGTIPSLGAPGVRDTRILPGDLDGPPPPDGTPNFFVRTVDDQQDPVNPTDRIEIYEFAVDWTTLTFSFTLANTLLPAPFQIMLCNRNSAGVRDCIPEPNTTSTVDALSNRPMMQAKYRQFATPAIVFNQTIDARGVIPNSLGFTPAHEVAGIRWYLLRKPAAAWVIRQQGTYAPQPINATQESRLLHRWMGSAAIDKFGNIALGYSITNSDSTQPVFPGIRYTGRRFNDVRNLLPQGEKIILDGINSQTGGFGLRWGDYSAMNVDPSDDCTFWYATHVAGSGGTGPRPTQFASFKFDNCKK